MVSPSGSRIIRAFKLTAVRVIDHYRRISRMTYQPKSVDKMAQFEILTFCISLNSSRMSTYCSKCKGSNRIKRINRDKHTICIEFQGSNHIIDK